MMQAGRFVFIILMHCENLVQLAGAIKVKVTAGRGEVRGRQALANVNVQTLIFQCTYNNFRLFIKE